MYLYVLVHRHAVRSCNTIIIVVWDDEIKRNVQVQVVVKEGLGSGSSMSVHRLYCSQPRGGPVDAGICQI